MAQQFDFFLSMETEMAFGLKVNDYSKASEGAYGYTLKIDMSDYNVNKMVFVQATNQPLGLPEPVVDEASSLITLQNYCDDADCPDLAFSFNGVYLTIFFKEATFPYADDDSRFAFSIYRNTKTMTTSTSKMDCPIRDKELVKAYALESFYQSLSIRTPYPIQRTIELEEERIRNEA